MISSGKSSIHSEDLKEISDSQLVSYYLGINEIPCIINSPIRQDRNPSFGLYSPNGVKIYFHDFSTRERGGIYDLLGKMWNMDYANVIAKVYKDFNMLSTSSVVRKSSYQGRIRRNNDTTMECKVREWREYDIKYWESYGITLPWLKYANVYPISHKIIIKNGQRYVFGADKYAYAYVEFKEGKTTLKIYQPYNKNGFKWANKHDKSVISLWTKVPEYGDRICICSSLKDALCLWANTGIPALAIQGEGYSMSDTAVSELKRRYKEIYILLDNDEAGVQDALKLSESTGFTNIVLPKEYGAKDVSDLYLLLRDKECFKSIIIGLFK